jgi:hypothetical protein
MPVGTHDDQIIIVIIDFLQDLIGGITDFYHNVFSYKGARRQLCLHIFAELGEPAPDGIEDLFLIALA